MGETGEWEVCGPWPAVGYGGLNTFFFFFFTFLASKQKCDGGLQTWQGRQAARVLEFGIWLLLVGFKWSW